MTEKRNEPLGELFTQHTKRKDAEAAEARAKGVEQKGWTSACEKMLRSVVRPVLDRYVSQIAGEGHKAKVAERLENHVHPGLDMELELTSSSSGLPFASKITFQCHYPKGTQVTREIRSASGEKRELGSEEWMTEVTEKLVERHLLRFVDAVLKAN